MLGARANGETFVSATMCPRLPGPLVDPLVHSRSQSLRSFWPAAGIESSGSNHFEITKEITEFCPSGLTQPSSMAHARNGCSQSSRFQPQARRIVGSGDENAFSPDLSAFPYYFFVLLLVYKALHGLAPSYISDLLNFKTYSRSLRSSCT